MQRVLLTRLLKCLGGTLFLLPHHPAVCIQSVDLVLLLPSVTTISEAEQRHCDIYTEQRGTTDRFLTLLCKRSC